MLSRRFGIPPETIKDSLQLGLDVPKVCVVDSELIDSLIKY